MPRAIDWNETEEIGILLQEHHPEIEPYSVRFTDLHRYVTELPGFTGDPVKSTEPLLEAIQAAWNEEYEDARPVTVAFTAPREYRPHKEGSPP